MEATKLVLTEMQASDLMEATSVHLSHGGVYRQSSISNKIKMLTAQLLTARKLLEVQHTIADMNKVRLDKEYFKEFMKYVANSYLYVAYEERVAKLQHAIKTDTLKKKDRDNEVFKFYNYVLASPIVQKLVDGEDFKEDLFDAKTYEKNVFNILQTKFDFGIKSRSALGFYKEPSKYIHSSKYVAYMLAIEGDVKEVILALHIGVAFISNQDDLAAYIKSLNPYTPRTESEEIISRLHGFSISKKAIYNHRLSEILNITRTFMSKDRFGFDTVLTSVVKSIVYCKQSRIHSFLEVTNLIINNLLVEAFSNRKMKSQLELEINKIITYADSMNPNVVILVNSIGNYVETYYKNKHERACAYSIGAAMKQALSYMSKREPDLFTKSKREAK